MSKKEIFVIICIIIFLIILMIGVLIWNKNYINSRNSFSSVVEDNGYINYNGVEIKNESSCVLSPDILKPNKPVKNKKDIFIFHTHTTEAYSNIDGVYSNLPTSEFKTLDKNYSVVKVGDELTKQLEDYNFNITHDETVHDYPSLNHSYERARYTVQNYLSKNPDTEIIIDLHRDAKAYNEYYAPTANINGTDVAQLMFVIGKCQNNHENWQKNLQFAIQIQQKANELYPGLFLPIIFREAEYNHNLATGSLIIEVGATHNTIEQALYSMKYLAEIMEEI